MTEEQAKLISQELDQTLTKFEAILQIKPDEWQKVETLYGRLIKLDTVFSTIAKWGRNLKRMSEFFDKMRVDFPDSEEIIKLWIKTRKYMYGMLSDETGKEK